MTDTEKIKILADALREINKIIFAVGAPLGSREYLAIRTVTIGALAKMMERES